MCSLLAISELDDSGFSSAANLSCKVWAEQSDETVPYSYAAHLFPL